VWYMGYLRLSLINVAFPSQRPRTDETRVVSIWTLHVSAKANKYFDTATEPLPHYNQCIARPPSVSEPYATHRYHTSARTSA